MSKESRVGLLVKDNFEQLAQHVDKATKSYDKFGNSVTKALNKTRLIGFVGALKNTVDAMTKASKAEADYVENMNLLKVSYDNNIGSATKLINKLKDMYGLDPSGLTKTLGTYKQMTSAMGMANETSALLSENLLKMQEDVASLYNLDFETVGRKFQSALAGQSRALYSLGVDITKTSLQQELYNMGIEKNINELNKASKTALTYIVMEKQLANAYGDASKTINSLANQTKIWQEQTAIAARQIKALVIPVLQVIISYANGIIMAFNGVMEAILKFFGVDVDEMASQFGIGSVEVADGFDNIGNAAAGAGKKIDKLKLGLRGFDKLNVITTPTDSGSSGSGGAGGGAGGIDAGIAKHLKEYNLKDAANNATIIRDRIMEWLKMLKPIEESLGRIASLTWEALKYVWDNVLVPMGKWAKETFLPTLIETIASGLDAVYEVAQTIKPVLKWIMDNVVIPIGKGLGKTLINILKDIKEAFDKIASSTALKFLFGGAGLLVGFKKLLDIGGKLATMFGATKLGGAFSIWWKTLSGTTKATGSLVAGFRNMGMTLEDVTSKSTKSILGFKVNVDALKSAAAGAVTAFLGFEIVKTSWQDINENGLTILNTIGLIAGAITGIVGAIQLVQSAWIVFKTLILATNPILLAIAAIAAGIAIVVGQIIDMNKYTGHWTNEEKKLYEQQKRLTNQAKEYRQELEKTREQILKNHEAELVSVTNAESMVNELENMVDENGKVIKGDKDHAEFIINQLNEAYGTHMKLVGDRIEGYDKEIQKVKDLIQQKKAEILLKVMEEEYTEAIKNRKKATENMTNAQQQLSDYENQHAAIIKNNEYLEKRYKDAILSGSQERIDQAKREYDDFRLQHKGVLSVYDEKKRTLDEYSLAYEQNCDDIMAYEKAVVDFEKNAGKNIEEIYNQKGTDIVKSTRDTLVNETAVVKELTPELVNKWKNLAKESSGEYALGLDKLDDDTKKAIMEAVGVTEEDVLPDKMALLASNSEEEFLREFSKLPSNVQQEVVDKMQQKGHSISQELQKGINQINPTVKINADTSGIVSAIKTSINGKKFNVTTDASGNVRLNAYAKGGFVDKGELFVAREAGAEMVGSINGKTAVANNDQIVEAISIGVARAMSGRSTNVNIIADGDTQGLMKFINFKQQQQNRQYGL